jgi:hypothetical protein
VCTERAEQAVILEGIGQGGPSEETKECAATMRRLTLHDGGIMVEGLEGKHKKPRTYSYSIMAGPLLGDARAGVSFSQNVREARGTIVRQTWVGRPAGLVELLFSSKGVNRVEVTEERIHAA